MCTPGAHSVSCRQTVDPAEVHLSGCEVEREERRERVPGQRLETRERRRTGTGLDAAEGSQPEHTVRAIPVVLIQHERRCQRARIVVARISGFRL